jgi:hypothetical protein
MDRTPAQVACDVFLSWASPGAGLTHHSQTPNAMLAWEKTVQAVMPCEPASRAELLEEAQQRAFRERRSVEDVLLDMLMVSSGKKVDGTLVIVAPEAASEEEFTETLDRLKNAHDGPVIILSHNWRAMSGDELRAELDRIEEPAIGQRWIYLGSDIPHHGSEPSGPYIVVAKNTSLESPESWVMRHEKSGKESFMHAGARVSGEWHRLDKLDKSGPSAKTSE